MTSALRGGGGVGPKADRVIQLSKGGCVNLRTRGGGGTKIPKFCGRHMCMAPWADGNMAEAAGQLGNMVEHPNPSQHIPGLRAD